MQKQVLSLSEHAWSLCTALGGRDGLRTAHALATQHLSGALHSRVPVLTTCSTLPTIKRVVPSPRGSSSIFKDTGRRSRRL
ncbi:hypothetical protein VTO73DRAFT_243 [Trametes versicolor]